MDAKNFKFKIKDDKGIEEMSFYIDFLNLQPIKQRNQSKVIQSAS